MSSNFKDRAVNGVVKGAAAVATGVQVVSGIGVASNNPDIQRASLDAKASTNSEGYSIAGKNQEEGNKR